MNRSLSNIVGNSKDIIANLGTAFVTATDNEYTRQYSLLRQGLFAKLIRSVGVTDNTYTITESIIGGTIVMAKVINELKDC